MIASLRTYFKSRIAQVNADYKEIDDPIGDDDLSKVNLDHKYKIVIAANNPDYTGNSYIDSIDASIQLFNKSKLCAVDSYDELYSLGILVKNCIISPLQVKSQLPFNEILVNRMDVEALNTNDKTFRCTINFTIRIDFTFN